MDSVDRTLANQALWRAVETQDLSGARRALFQGADPQNVRPCARWAPQFGEETPLTRVILGHPAAPYAPVSLPLLDLLLHYATQTGLQEDRLLTSFALMSQASNAPEAFACLTRHGATVRYEQLAALVLMPASQLTAANPDIRLAQMDLVWTHLSAEDQSIITRRLPQMWIQVEERLGEPPAPVGRRWMQAHGIALPEVAGAAHTEASVLNDRVVAFRPRSRPTH